MLREHLTKDWQEFADRFIPLYEENQIWISKLNGKPLPQSRMGATLLPENEVTAKMMNMARIRNCIYRSTLRRNYSECTIDEIVNDKLSRLMTLIKKRPELEQIIKEKL